MAVAANADDYTNGRVGIFFPANNSTSADGNLTGQCVTLDKWFFAEMCDGFPSPFAARGDARYVGINLVAQGLATEIPAGQQQRGDVVCYEYGQYGHTGILLSGNRLFQENANVAGATRKVLSDGTVVYSSTIVTLYPSLGGVAPKFYRLKNYSEGGSMANPNNGDVVNILGQLWGRAPNPEDYGYANQSWHDAIYGMLAAYPWVNRKHILDIDYPQAVKDRDNATGIAETRSSNFQRICDATVVDRLPDEQVTTDNIIAKYNQMAQAAASVEDLKAQVASLSTRPTEDDVAALKQAANDANAKLIALQQQQADDTATGNAFMRWIGGILAKLKG